MALRTLAVLMTLTLVACSAPTDEVPTAVVAEPGVTFSVSPQPQAACDPAAPFALNVAWEVKDVDDPKFDIRLNSTQGQLWARENVAKGEKSTDPWGREGMWLILLDRNTQRVLATAQVPPLVCP